MNNRSGFLKEINNKNIIEETAHQVSIQPPFDNKSEHMVYIVHINHPHHFYVRLTKYYNFIQEIENLKSVSKLSTVRVHQTVLFNMDKTNKTPKYGRARIMGLRGDNMKVFDIYAIDYGFIENDVPLGRLWNCDPSILSIPDLAVVCLLGHCAKRGKDWRDAIDAFKSYAGDEPAKMVVEGSESGKLKVTLYNTCPDDLATLLALTNFTTLGYVHNDKNQLEPAAAACFQIPTYKFKQLKTHVPFHVRVISGKTLTKFYVAEVTDYRNYLDYRDTITNHSKQAPKVKEGTMKNNDAVSVKGFWGYERGIIKKTLNSNEAVVHMVDLGKDEVVCVGNMRKIPGQCMAMPIVAICCSAEDIGMEPHILFHPGNEFDITIMDLGFGFETPNTVKISNNRIY